MNKPGSLRIAAGHSPQVERESGKCFAIDLMWAEKIGEDENYIYAKYHYYIDIWTMPKEELVKGDNPENCGDGDIIKIPKSNFTGNNPHWWTVK
jgi:hypothetical protein